MSESFAPPEEIGPVVEAPAPEPELVITPQGVMAAPTAEVSETAAPNTPETAAPDGRSPWPMVIGLLILVVVVLVVLWATSIL